MAALPNFRELIGDLYEDAREWCEEGEKWASWRIAVLAYFAYGGVCWIRATAENPFPERVFKGITLVFHEMGHILWIPFGRTMTILGGSLTQLLVPMIAGVYLLLRQRDYFGAVFAKGWLAFSLWDLSVYVADAASQNLPLVSMGPGEPEHDWYTLLTQWHLLNSDQGIASGIRVAAIATWLSALGHGAWLCWLMIKAQRARSST